MMINKSLILYSNENAVYWRKLKTLALLQKAKRMLEYQNHNVMCKNEHSLKKSVF